MIDLHKDIELAYPTTRFYARGEESTERFHNSGK
jgi:hypothetical protein